MLYEGFRSTTKDVSDPVGEGAAPAAVAASATEDVVREAQAVLSEPDTPISHLDAVDEALMSDIAGEEGEGVSGSAAEAVSVVATDVSAVVRSFGLRSGGPVDGEHVDDSPEDDSHDDDPYCYGFGWASDSESEAEQYDDAYSG